MGREERRFQGLDYAAAAHLPHNQQFSVQRLKHPFANWKPQSRSTWDVNSCGRHTRGLVTATTLSVRCPVLPKKSSCWDQNLLHAISPTKSKCSKFVGHAPATYTRLKSLRVNYLWDQSWQSNENQPHDFDCKTLRAHGVH